MKKTTYRLIGVMSGTSLDGVDMVFTEISFLDSVDYEIKLAQTFPYPEEWVSRLNDAIHLDQAALNELDNEYTAYLAEIIKKFIDQNQLDLIDAVCSHGHTVKHLPKKGITFQIGNLPKLARLTGIPVVCDFRVQDVELGGQGAPLVPMGDRLLFGEYKYCINLGGFANVSQEDEENRKAYDICPVNTVLNYFSRKEGKQFDKNGQMARMGKLDADLLEKLNALKFYSLQPPKSLGIEWVNAEILPMLENSGLDNFSILKTYTVHVAIQIANVLDDNSESAVLLTGGGVYNSYLIEELRKFSACDFVVPGNQLVEFKEALIFALLGALKLRGEINILRSVTGARIDHSSGRIFKP
ncbi:anhydro-N-acetylmuramic acid kinase [Christiangramia fulva]|uniref:Anhydro-N-acetylmuramic acid kinase n=1 Tax=Christiangramia fulva TaxID=2126553 RepID=A0A2R3Z201_9FLAO|nr:anhydro-N-acetylmuramic acid kinase [Christiangramia fulva]AVR44265.1 anhydro-N-acetylmuramic acid kinase [Christiangramia fulva]